MEIEDINFDTMLTLANGTKKRFGNWTKQDLLEAGEYLKASAAISSALASEEESAVSLLTDTGCLNLQQVTLKGGKVGAAAEGILARAAALESELASRVKVGQP